jgi:TRAP-type C4-dicarboxylate transport system substrate-binding protein
MEFNEVTNIADFQALAKPIYKEFEPVVGADLIEAILKQK